MPSLIGPRIRDRRRALGVTQAALAARVGISPSYLNLIEANKRSIGGTLLRKIADSLELQLEHLDGATERRLLTDLVELATGPALAALRIDPASAEGLAGHHQGWARALVELHRTLIDREQAVSALSDRLTQDPFLGDAVHDMITRVSAIRSSAEILESVPDLEASRRERFVAIIAAESRRLGDIAKALAGFFDKANNGRRSTLPVEQVDDFLLDRGNHFPVLEEAADELRAILAAEAGGADEAALARWLRSKGREVRYGLDVPESSEAIEIDERQPVATRRFTLARHAAEVLYAQGPIAAEVAASPLLTSEAAQRRAARVLASYVAGAVVLPYDELRAAAVAMRYDIEALSQRFGASFEQVAHRLVTLRRPGAEGIPFGMLRVDAAGYVTKRYPLPQLPLPRHGNACPLWAAYGALHSPGTIVRQLVEFPTGYRALFVARTVEKNRPAFGMPRRLLSVMLACDALHADRTVYGEGFDVSSSGPAVPVGFHCRLCTRAGCAYRQEDPIIDA